MKRIRQLQEDTIWRTEIGRKFEVLQIVEGICEVKEYSNRMSGSSIKYWSFQEFQIFILNKNLVLQDD